MGRAILGREPRDRPDRDHDRHEQPGHEQPAGPETLLRTEAGRRWFGAFGPIEGRGIRGICHLKDRGVRDSFRESQYFAKWPGGIQRKKRDSSLNSTIPELPGSGWLAAEPEATPQTHRLRPWGCQPQPPKPLSPSWDTINHGGVQRGVSKKREECSTTRARIVLKRARRPAAIPGRTTSAKPWHCGCACYHLARSNRHFRESPGPARELPCQTFSAT